MNHYFEAKFQPGDYVHVKDTDLNGTVVAVIFYTKVSYTGCESYKLQCISPDGKETFINVNACRLELVEAKEKEV